MEQSDVNYRGPDLLLTSGSLPQPLRLATPPAYSYLNIFTSSHMPIPVKRLQLNLSTGKLEEFQATPLFIKGPIPLTWCSQVALLPGKAFALAMALWWLHGMSKGGEFKLSKKALQAFNVSRDACNDGLKRLESVGLIIVTRLPGRRPLVQVVTGTQSHPSP